MKHVEIIEYGNIGVYSDVASVFELYERLGISDRLNADDIKSPTDIRLCGEDCNKLRQLIGREAQRRPRFAWGRSQHNTVFYEWVTFGPSGTGTTKGAFEIHIEK